MCFYSSYSKVRPINPGPTNFPPSPESSLIVNFNSALPLLSRLVCGLLLCPRRCSPVQSRRI
ncbi:hypothetical protein An08g02625 [Aspergillus niger]|uniref:Uncharacterized protein n=2 Tax=Aspergillus niger TaxID=5061 RepID=A2QQI3_ASPNC|nr:hypothetical protein An08g02625 [Aspergillus niger]CAK45299.1 hypothetical protein An08g02625 [Aspergillus niger]